MRISAALPILAISLALSGAFNGASAQTHEDIARYGFKPAPKKYWPKLYVDSSERNEHLGTNETPNLRQHLSDFITDDPRCLGEVKSTISAVFRYEAAVAYDRTQEADREFKKLQRRIFEELGPRHACYPVVTQAYLATSVFILHPGSRRAVMSGTLKKKLDEAKIEPKFHPRNALIVLMSIQLMKSGRIVLLTPELRQELGGAWIKRQRKGDAFEYQVLGAYECGSTTISIDSGLRPFDLGGVLVHELDHLFRDKFVSLDAFNEYFPERDGQPDWESFLLYDEALASTHAAYQQRALRAVDTGKAGTPYLAISDLSLFTQGGALETVLDEFFARDLNRSHSAESLLNAFFYRTQPDQQMFTGYARILEVVRVPYFGQLIWDARLGDLNATTGELTQLSSFYSRWGNTSRRDQISVREVAPGKLAEPEPEVGDGFLLESDFARLLGQVVAGVMQDIEGVSPLCRKYEEAVRTGQVHGYAGLSVTSSRPGESGSRPGESGSRPGESGSRPGESGSRPATTVRPCLDLRGQL